MPYGASDSEAVELCRDWMVFLGASDTVKANGVISEVCDLYSARYLAWVDKGRGNLDLDPIERAAALAASDGRAPLVFVPGGIRPVARLRADALGVAHLRFGSYDGALDGANTLGRELRAAGLAPIPAKHR